MNAADREELRQVLIAISGDQALKIGVRELVDATLGLPRIISGAALPWKPDCKPLARAIRMFTPS